MAALPAVILPALGWGVGNKLQPVRYPRDITAAARLVDGDPRPGVVACLPFTTYRAYAWNGYRPVLDVLPRWFARPVVYASDLPLTIRGRPSTSPGTIRSPRGSQPASTRARPTRWAPSGCAGSSSMQPVLRSTPAG